MRSTRGRNRTSDATEMAHASGQDWVEQDGCVAILPCAGAVPPPGQCARHGTIIRPRSPRMYARPATSVVSGSEAAPARASAGA